MLKFWDYAKAEIFAMLETDLSNDTLRVSSWHSTTVPQLEKKKED